MSPQVPCRNKENAMLYREAGQFKTSYIADSQIFPIRQDRIIFTLAVQCRLMVVHK